MAAKEPLSIKIHAPESMLSYLHIWEARVIPGTNSKPKFSVVLVFDSETDISALKTAAIDVAVDVWPDAIKMFRAGKLKWPFKSDPETVKEKGYPEGSVFLNVNTEGAPGVVGLVADPQTGNPMPLVDPAAQAYSGCYGIVSLTAKSYDVSGNRGVTFHLNNVQITRSDTPRLDGRIAAADEFTADPNARANLADLERDDDPQSGDSEGRAEDSTDQSALDELMA